MKHMLKKAIFSCAFGCFIIGTAIAEDTSSLPCKPYWKDIQVVAVNKEQPRSAFMTYADRSSALSSRYEKVLFTLCLTAPGNSISRRLIKIFLKI